MALGKQHILPGLWTDSVSWNKRKTQTYAGVKSSQSSTEMNSRYLAS